MNTKKPDKKKEIKRGEKGFTLMEVLVAMAVLSLSLTIVLQVFASSLRAKETANRLTTASFLAQEKIEEIFMGGFPEIATAGGDFGKDYPRFGWEKRVSAVDPFAGENPEEREDIVRKIELEINWPGKKGKEKIKLTTFMARRED